MLKLILWFKGKIKYFLPFSTVLRGSKRDSKSSNSSYDVRLFGSSKKKVNFFNQNNKCKLFPCYYLHEYLQETL